MVTIPVTCSWTLSAHAGAPCVPQWDPAVANPGLNGEALVVATDDQGDMVVGGLFTGIGARAFARCARWDGASWSAYHSGFNDSVRALAMFNGDLHAAGHFTIASMSPAMHAARWDGSSWIPLAGGLDANALALAVSSVSGAPLLYAGGAFANADGSPAKRIASWDGASWSPLGSGVTIPGQSSAVYAIKEFDLGSGTLLAVGGLFTVAGGQLASNIAVWNGASWSPLASGLDGPVRALEVFDDGSGPALYAGGDFEMSGGVLARRVARWNGATWTAVGGSGSWGIGSSVRALTVFDDGSGARLVAGGSFTIADGVVVDRLAAWDGAQWQPTFGGADGIVSALAVGSGQTQDQLLLGGAFTLGGGIVAQRAGIITGCADPAIPGDLNNDGVVDTADLGVLLTSFGSSDPIADINQDGVVDTADLGVLLTNFGAGA
ncbi:MAG: hypothetical protein H6813_00485 [Phycisphaeraceae bacterium]|nr:hypothetical protein [Phycisphaeraceae bacterium]MCB9847438.1 hypothetical protein [Phycisphaeraceae bacterium]